MAGMRTDRQVAPVDQIGKFQLRRVLSVSAEGLPVLEGANAELILTSRFSRAEAGCMAVCQPVRQISNEPGADRLVVPGVVEPAFAPDPDMPLRFGTGEAALELHPDGPIRLRGKDIALDLAGQLRLLGARIDLN